MIIGATAAKLPDLMEPFWIEIAVPDPVTGQRAVLHTGPFTADGVESARTALKQFTDQSRIDVIIREMLSKR